MLTGLQVVIDGSSELLFKAVGVLSVQHEVSHAKQLSLLTALS